MTSMAAAASSDAASGRVAKVALSRAHRLAARLRAGNVRVNAAVAPDFSMPFGGARMSGWGRENGREGVESFTELKSVAVNLD